MLKGCRSKDGKRALELCKEAEGDDGGFTAIKCLHTLFHGSEEAESLAGTMILYRQIQKLNSNIECLLEIVKAVFTKK